MSKIIVIGAGLGGMSAAYDLREKLGGQHEITVIGKGDQFNFMPSNPWLAVGWRSLDEATLEVKPYLKKKKIHCDGSGVQTILASENQMLTGKGETLSYDYLLICTGPGVAFDQVAGLLKLMVCVMPKALCWLTNINAALNTTTSFQQVCLLLSRLLKKHQCLQELPKLDS